MFDITSRFPTMSALAEHGNPAAALREVEGVRVGDLDAIAANTPPDRRDPARPWLLAPIDLAGQEGGQVSPLRCRCWSG